MHSERPVPQLESERLAMKLIRLIVEDYFNRDGGAQERWKFCLLASSILADITQNNVTKGKLLTLKLFTADEYL